MTQKKCTHCGEHKTVDNFSRKSVTADGLRNECKSCCREWRVKNREAMIGYKRKHRANNREALAASSREYYKMNREERLKARGLWEIENPEKLLAHQTVKRAIRSGELVKPDTCSCCGTNGSVDGHHPDYSEPLHVVWLCHACHMQEHASQNKEAA
jgi:hypothetical protein